MYKDSLRRAALKKFISVNMAENPKFVELLEHMDKLPPEYIEELYTDLDRMEPLKAVGAHVMLVEAIKKLRDKITLSLRYHE